MLTNIRGLIDQLDITSSKAMMPLYEAISNSLDAISDRFPDSKNGKISISLLQGKDLVSPADDSAILIDGVVISDNGIGFDDDHLRSFGEVFTSAKATKGGKGLGRFTFLKIFKTAEISSVFEKDGKRWKRDFKFSIDDEIQSEAEPKETSLEIGTTITLRGFHDGYVNTWPRDENSIAERIISHFLIYFAAGSCPSVVLNSPRPISIDLNKLFNDTVKPHIADLQFSIGEHNFKVQAFKHIDGRARHSYHLCARGRDVTSGKLRDLLPELPERFLGTSQESYALITLVSGDYLDKHSNNVRTEIVFQTDEELDLDSSLVTKRQLNAKIAETLRSGLAVDLSVTNREKISQIEKFVETAPEYRSLTHERYRPVLEQRIPPGLSDEKLDEALLHIRREIEDSVRKEERNVAAMMDKGTFDQYQQQMKELIEKMNDVGKSKLADYIAHRRTILDLVDSSLKKVKEDGNYPFEEVLHKMIFPMGVTSKDIFVEQQNLWILDERLCFHTLLTSDKKLKSVKGLEKTSGKEPDIFSFFWDTPIGIAEPDDLNGGGIVIIEFKRPGRDDYAKDPADQIIQRFVEIDQGGVTDIDGRTINPKNLRYLGYLIADLTPTLRKQVAMRYHESADGEGYFYTLSNGTGYIEIISYDKLLRDAKRRNRVLFEKLGVHKN